MAEFRRNANKSAFLNETGLSDNEIISPTDGTVIFMHVLSFLFVAAFLQREVFLYEGFPVGSGPVFCIPARWFR